MMGHIYAPCSLLAQVLAQPQQHATGGARVPVVCQFNGLYPVVILQVVFAGVFLLTRASQPAAPAEQSTELKQASGKARVVYVGVEPEQLHSLTTAPSNEHKWRLSAVRSAQSGEPCMAYDLP